MKKRLMTGLVASAMILGAATVASAKGMGEKLTIYTGSTTGNYHKVVGPNLKKALEKMNYKVRLVPSKGSVENINKVKDQENVFGLGQTDVAMNYIDEQEGFDTVGRNGNLGQECGFLVASSDIDDLSALAGKKVAVGKKDSGTLFTYENLATVDENLAAVSAKPKGGKRYVGKVANNAYAAYWFVSVPDPKNKTISDVVDNEKVDFMSLSDVNLGKFAEGDNPVYTHEVVPVKKNLLDKVTMEAEAICTSITVLADEEATSERVLNDMYEASKQVDIASKSLFGMAKGFYDKTKKTVKDNLK